MARTNLSAAKLERLCRMQAQAVFSIREMADQLRVSMRTVERSLALEQTKERVDELVGQYKAAGQRLASSRARWAVGRLIQLSSRDDETGRKALVDLLKLALERNTKEGSLEQGTKDNNEVTEELTKGWSENEWNSFAKLLSSGGQKVSATQAAD